MKASDIPSAKAAEIRPAYTAEEAANILRLHPVYFRRLMHRGQVPGAVRIGSTWRLPAHALDRILETGLSIHRATPKAALRQAAA